MDQGFNQAGDVAIVGMACVFPKAPDLARYWENITHKVDAIGEPPEDRGMASFFDPLPGDRYKTYCKRGGYLEELPGFDPSRFGIMPVAVDGAEPEHFLALQVAHDALVDAGFPDKPINRERTEVILGRGTYVSRGLVTVLHHGMAIRQAVSLLHELHPEHTPAELEAIEQQLRASIPPFSSETAPGLVPSVMAGLIANRLDLRGANFVVDAACASGLIALDIGARDLLSGKCDVVLTGAVQTSAAVFMNILFAQLGAVSRLPQLRPFSADADGTMIGEGVGMMVLKRRADAERDNHRIYALIRGVGTSSDGKAKGILAPRVEGEELALRRAYDSAGVEPSTIELIEAHGTGLPLGDVSEIQALGRVFGPARNEPAPCAIGSVKSMIGHLLPAAGVAGMIKAALSLYHRTLPPTLHCERPNPGMEIENTRFYLNTETRPWIHGATDFPRRAGVNAFGFGGINAHVVLEEYVGDVKPGVRDRRLPWDTELCVIQADTRAELIEKVRRLETRLTTASPVGLLDVIARFGARSVHGAHRLAIVASGPEELAKKAAHAADRLQDSGCRRIKDKSGIYFFEEPLAREGRLAFLFPGEGSQYPRMLADLCLHFPEVLACFDTLDRAFQGRSGKPFPSRMIFPIVEDPDPDPSSGEGLWQMEYAVDAVLTAGRALFQLLRCFDVHPQVILGHSSGEIMALEAAGAIELSGEPERVAHIIAGNEMIRGFLREKKIPDALLIAAGGGDREAILDVANNRGLLAMDNCPHQVVLCCRRDDLDLVMGKLRASGAICQVLPFSRPYHTPLFEPGRASLERFFDRVEIHPPKVELYSCMSAGPMGSEPSQIRKAVVGQWAAQVRFRETVEAMYASGVRLFAEVGPRGNLTGFVGDTLKGRPHLAVACNVHHRTGTTQLNHALGLLAAHGVSMNLAPLYSGSGDLNAESQRAAGTAVNQQSRGSGAFLSLGLPIPSLGDPAAFRKVPVQEARTENPTHGRPFDVAPLPETPEPPGVKIGLAPGSGSGQDRSTILEGHLETMEQFLETQERIMAAYFSRSGMPPVFADDQEKQETHIDALPSVPVQAPDSASSPGRSRGERAWDLVQPATPVAGVDKVAAAASAIPSHETSSEEGITRLLLALVRERTGYPTDMLRLDQNLEADLGIDSIKRIEIFGALADHVGAFDPERVEEMNRLMTLGDIVAFVLKASAHDGPGDRGPAASDPNRSDNETVRTLPVGGIIHRLDPGKEITVRHRLDPNQDLYLADHTLGGKVSVWDESLCALAVLPFAMGLEMMAQAARQLFPGKRFVGAKRVVTHDWVILDGRPIELEITARAVTDATADARIHIRIRGEDTADANDGLALAGTMIFDDTFPQAPEVTVAPPADAGAAVTPPERFYPHALFHGPSFQSVASLIHCGPDGVEAILESPPSDRLFRHTTRPEFLADPIVLDGAGQAVGLWAADRLDHDFVVFPVALTEARFYGPTKRSRARTLCRVYTRQKTDGTLHSDIALMDEDGTLRAALTGMVHKRIHMPASVHLFRGSREVRLSVPWLAAAEGLPPSLRAVCRKFDTADVRLGHADDHVLRNVIAHIVLSRKERDIWAGMGAEEPRRSDWLFERLVGKEAAADILAQTAGLEVWPADIEIVTDAEGRTFADGPWRQELDWKPILSMCQAKGTFAAVTITGLNGNGVEIEMQAAGSDGPVEGAPDLAAGEQALIETLGSDQPGQWAARIRCAKKAAARLFGLPQSVALAGLSSTALDPATGTVSLSVAEALLDQHPVLRGRCINVFSFCEHDRIIGIATHESGGLDE